MKNISLPEQRKLYKAYKEARLSEANHFISFYNTGSYSRPSNSEIMDKAKQDILEFVSPFEEGLIAEVKEDLGLVEV